ncbi:MAG: hypothetical protein WCI51_01580 [Lentisphaerota bacterium]
MGRLKMGILNFLKKTENMIRDAKVKEIEPAVKLRYNERRADERVNSNLKDNYGGENVLLRRKADLPISKRTLACKPFI